MPRQVLGLKILPDVDRQGMSRVSAAIKNAVGKGVLDSSTAKNFGAMASNAAKEFNSIVKEAKLVGLHKEADKFASRLTSTQDELVKAIEEMGRLQQRVGKDISQQQFADAQREMKERMDGLNARLSAELSSTQKVIDMRKRAVEEIEGRTAIESGRAMAEAFGDSVTDVWGKFTSQDFEGLTRGLAGAFKKAGSGLQARAAMGTGGAGAATGGLGKSLTALAGAAASLAAVVAAFAALAKIAMDADAQTKEFNATLLKGASAADFLTDTGADGFVNLTKHLNNARDAAFGLSYQFRTAPKEILGIVSAANEAGLTFKEMRGFVGKNVDELKAFTEVSRTALVYSKQLGQSTETIATQSAEWAHDLGMGLREVREGFDQIFTGAMQSGIGVKRFYTMVTTATANLALYNGRVEEAAGLIATLAKSLGETNAAEFVKGLTRGFADESYTERFKRMIIAGQGDISEIMGNSAQDTAKAFEKKFGENIPDAMRTAVKNATGVDMDLIMKGDAKALAQLGQMSEDQIRSVLQTAKTPEQYRELEKLVNLSQGMAGGISDQAKALDAMDMGGKLATILAGGLGGKELSEMSAIELAAFENYAGVSGEQLVILRKMDRQLRGEFEQIRAATVATQNGVDLTETQLDVLKRQNIEIRKGNDGAEHAFIQGTNKQVDSFNDYAQSQGDVLKASVEGGMQAQEAMAKQIVANTVSITALLETAVQHGLEKIADILQMIYDAVSQTDPNLREAKDKIVQSIEREEAALVAAQAEAKQELSALKIAYDKSNSPEERQAMAEDIKKKEAEIGRRGQLITTRGEEATKVRSQSTSGTISALWEEFKSGGEANTMAGAGMTAGFDPGKTAAALGITQEGRGLTMFDDIGKEMTEAQYLTLSEAEKARLQQENAAMKNVDELESIQESIDEGNDDAVSDIADGMALFAAQQAANAINVDPAERNDFIRKLMQGNEDAKSRLGAGLAGTGMEHLGVPFGVNVGQSMQDFLYRGGAMGGTVTPINQADQLLGAKPGGPVDKALGGMNGGQVIINISGGDTAKIYEVVKRAMRESGVRPPSGKGA